MKSKLRKIQIRGFQNGGIEYMSAQNFYTVIILSICRVLHEKKQYGPGRCNELIADLNEFLEREDLSTIAEELTWWADKYGIKY